MRRPEGAAQTDFDRWLAHRVRIFETFCLPSVLSQVKRPDYWLLGFDGERREAAEQVLAVVRGHDWIVPVWQRRSGGVHEHPSRLFDREVRERIGEHHMHVVTARLDNDDAINRWFLHDLHQYSAALLTKQPALEDFWVSFPTGVHYSAGECRLLNYPSNHFLARVVGAGRFRSQTNLTAMAVDHNQVFQHGSVFLATTTEPMWLQNVHGGNASNKVKRKLPKFASTQAMLARCGIDIAATKAARPGIFGRTAEARRRRRRLVGKVLRAIGWKQLRRG